MVTAIEVEISDSDSTSSIASSTSECASATKALADSTTSGPHSQRQSRLKAAAKSLKRPSSAVDEGKDQPKISEQHHKSPIRNNSRRNPRTKSPHDSKRRSRRNATAPLLKDLAQHILSSTPVLFITGAGLSAASGIRTFRGPDGLWSDVVWKKATRKEFRKDPLGWYNDFWLKHFPPHTYGEFYEANEGHEAISILTSMPNANVNVITQNIDGLHRRTRHEWNYEEKLIEAHGRLGLYKCIPEVESDGDISDDDGEEDEGQQRKVMIGSRRKQKLLRSGSDRSASVGERDDDLKPAARDNSDARVLCKYAFEESIPATMIEPPHVRNIISGIYNDGNPGSTVDSDYVLALQLHSSLNERKRAQKKPCHGTLQPEQMLINEPPLCPSCRRPVLPQALQFDESYHSHGHYQFERMERWIDHSSVIVFVGTSFAVNLTKYALDHARKENKFVYNFNIDGEGLETASWMSAENVVGDVQRTLPELVKACEEEFAAQYE